MHVVVPKAVGFNPANSFITINGVRHVFWVSQPEIREEVEQKFSFFREHRRKKYSDVCHAKLLHEHSHLKTEVAFMKVGNYALDPFCEKKDPYYRTGVTNGRLDTLESNGERAIYISSQIVSSNASKINLNCQVRVQTYHSYVSRRTIKVRCMYFDVHGDIDRKSAKVNAAFQSTDLPSSMGAAVLESVKAHLAGCLYLEHGVPREYQESAESFYSVAAMYAFEMLTAATTIVSLTRRTNIDVVQVQIKDTVFMLHEPGIIFDGLSDMMYGNGTQSYFRNSLTQEAYLNLVQNVPRMNDNNISNLLEITSFIKGLVIDHKVDIPNSLSDAWLAYRYSYGTTKMDVQDAIKFMKRHRDLGDWTHLKVHGTSNLVYQGISVICRAVATVSPRGIDKIEKVWRALYTYGLSPNFYVVWDMIPYSFIVDWFLPIGDTLNVWDTERQFNQYYSVKDVQFSLKYEAQNDIGVVSCYSRWLTGTPPVLQGRYMTEKDPSSKTIVKRVIDAGALLLG